MLQVITKYIYSTIIDIFHINPVNIRAKYDEFMKKWSEKRVERNRKIAENYPNLRELTGEYLLNSVKFLK